MDRRRMRVLHIGKYYPPVKGGIETHVSGLCEALAPHTDISVLVANRERATVREMVHGIPVTRAGTLATLSGAALCPSMVRSIRCAAADLIHLHTPNPGGVLALLAARWHGPLIVSHHSDVVRQKVLNTFFQPVLDRLLARCSALVTTSEAYLESSPVLIRFRDRCRVIPYAIDTAAMDTVHPEIVQGIRRRYPGPLILGVGRMVSYKGFDYLIRAMRAVPGTLILVGEGPLLGSLQRLAAGHGIGDRVRFTGAVRDARPYYHAADIFVLPSVTEAEAFGIVQLEAMAAGKPVINTNLSTSVPHVSPHQVSGLTVPCRDTAALTSALNLLLQREELCRRFGEAGRRRVQQEFSYPQLVRRMTGLYEEILSASACADLQADPSTAAGAAPGPSLST